jgi:hypothetical protein
LCAVLELDGEHVRGDGGPLRAHPDPV